jgi:hypothetical protein
MKITAPDEWLDDVDVGELRAWFLSSGWSLSGRFLYGPNGQEVILPEHLRVFADWKHRLLEAIEQSAKLQGITAVEWFANQRIETLTQHLTESREKIACRDARIAALERACVCAEKIKAMWRTANDGLNCECSETLDADVGV